MSVSMDKVNQSILAGIVKAQKKFEKMYDFEHWVDEGPEYFITVGVAEELLKIAGPKYVTLEHSVKSASKDAGIITRGRKALRVLRGRCDILLWWGGDEPRAMIELKRSVVNFTKIRSDLRRIQSVLCKETKVSSIQFGAIGFFTWYWKSKTPKKMLRARMVKLLKAAQCEARPDIVVKLRLSRIQEEADEAWAAGCLHIRRKRASELN